jgi:hypothetical protein
MCLIVDINIAHKVFLTDSDPDYRDVHGSLFTDKPITARMVHGGKLTQEYLGNNRVRRLIVELGRSGRAIKVDDALVDAEELKVKESGMCRSDDEHIIALARVSKVRLLCTNDDNLTTDFTNKNLLDSPRGKVYKHATHKPLLVKFCKKS